MRKILSIATVLLSLLACNTESKQTPVAKLSGTIENINTQKVLLYHKMGIDTLNIDSLGNFKLEKNFADATYSKLVLGKKVIPIYLKNGFSLNLKTSKANFSKDATFEGLGSKENNLLSNKINLASELAYYPKMFKLNPEQFILKSDSVKDLFSNLANSYAKSADIDSTFLETFKTDIKYEQLYHFAIYTAYHNYFMHEELELPANAAKRVESAIVDNNSLVNSKQYIAFMDYTIKKRFEEATDNENQEEDNTLDYLKWINSEFNSQNLKNELFYKATRYMITYVDEEGRDKLYSTFSKLNTDTIYQKNINETYASFEKLRKGKPAPKWSYPDVSGNEYALGDFKGKYVYIDVWATWCGPCKAEIPELAKLVTEYKGKDIVFVSVSVDDNRGAWKKMLEKENFDWIQIHADKAWKSKIIKENGIRGIPRFMMVDKDGNISSVNAPNPSSDDIRPFIDKLLSI
jgi:thiol-disulfide isomerase/thioredoxin